MSTRPKKPPRKQFAGDKQSAPQTTQDAFELERENYRSMPLDHNLLLPPPNAPSQGQLGDLLATTASRQPNLTNLPTVAQEADGDLPIDSGLDNLAAHGDLGAMFAGLDQPPKTPPGEHEEEDAGSVSDKLPVNGDIGAMFADPDHPLPGFAVEHEVAGIGPKRSRPPPNIYTGAGNVEHASELDDDGNMPTGQIGYSPIMGNNNDSGDQEIEAERRRKLRSSRAGRKRKASDAVNIEEGDENNDTIHKIDPASGRTIHAASTPTELLNAPSPYPNAAAALAALREPSWHGKHHIFTDREVTEMATKFYDASIDCRNFVDKVKDAETQARTGKCGVKLLDRGIDSDDLWQASFNLANSVRRLHNQREGTWLRSRIDPTNIRGRKYERDWGAWQRVSLICEALMRCKKLVEDAVDQPQNLEHLLILAPEYALKSRLGNMKLNDNKAKKVSQATNNAVSDGSAANQSSAAPKIASPIVTNRPTRRRKNTKSEDSKPPAKKSKVSAGSKSRGNSLKPNDNSNQKIQPDLAIGLKLEQPPEDEDTNNFWPSYPTLDRPEPIAGHIETPYYTPTNLIGYEMGALGTWYPAGDEIESPLIPNDGHTSLLPPPSAFAPTPPITTSYYPRMFDSSEQHLANTPVMTHAPNMMFNSLGSNSNLLWDEATGQMRLIGGFSQLPDDEYEEFQPAGSEFQFEQEDDRLEEDEIDDPFPEDQLPEK